MRARHHYTFARQHPERVEASVCAGFVRRIYVRPGSRELRSTARVGWMCDVCGDVWLDDNFREVLELARFGELAEFAAFHKARVA